MTIDYYRTLGVLDDAEDIVIKAAYRALAQRYHPDRWAGDAAEATRRMGSLNEAYAVLSDPEKRRAYDAQRDKTQYQEDSKEHEKNDDASSVDKDWILATKYKPALLAIEEGLNKLSRELAFTYRLLLLEHKNFHESQVIATRLEKDWLEKYFGKDEETIGFAKELILEGRKDAAKELNNVVRVLGCASPDVIDKISSDFNTIRNQRQTKAEGFGTRRTLAWKIIMAIKENASAASVFNLINEYRKKYNKAINAEVTELLDGWMLGDSLKVWIFKGRVFEKATSLEVTKWLELDAEL